METLKLIIQLIPLLLELIKVIEAEVPENGKGSAKLEFIKEVLTNSYPKILEIWGLVEKLISASVTLFNTTNVFKKSN
jgi:hypothetical protein